ncbi:hypothetical protein DYB35_001940 [Aphanomyces astaci]|uniref:DNA/RNA-binding protein Kin17 WH-like domain-containing protein n=1 Tax=Aphanomyces astaci TaxID=112090 RepID=A0A418D0R5_APHAT|nr:hypothetical protein DYB35_001940 [Aphanomyces astaci]
MLIVASNPTKFIQGYSEQFERSFLENLRRSHTTKRVSAHVVYNEYIRDKNHVHMNATRWTTLSGFVQYLGKTGKCVVDETEKGWFIQYINNDPVAMARQEELKRKRQALLDHEERNRRFIQAQVKEAQEKFGLDDDGDENKPAHQPRVEKVSMSLKLESKSKLASVESKKSIQSAFGQDVDDKSGKDGAPSSSFDHETSWKGGKRSAVDAIMEEETRKRQRRDEDDERANRLDHWIQPGLVVKVMDKDVGDGAYYKQKGLVVRVHDTYVAEVRMLESRDVLRLDQEDLETVIPLVGRPVRVVNGIGRGALATLVSIDERAFCAAIQLTSGPKKYSFVFSFLLFLSFLFCVFSCRGRTLPQVEYEDICKVDT